MSAKSESRVQTQNSIPKPLKIIATVLIVLNILYIIWYFITVVVSLFQQDQGLGWVAILSPVSYATFMGTIFFAASISSFAESLDEHQPTSRYWLKLIGYFIFSTIGAHVAALLAAFLSTLAAGLILQAIRAIVG